MFSNLAPFCTMIFGWLLLNEKVSRLDLFAVLLGFTAVMCITFGMVGTKINTISNPKEYARHDHAFLLPFICLIGIPILVSSQNILLRFVRNINENTLSCYNNPFSVFSAYILLRILNISVTKIFEVNLATKLMFLYSGSSMFAQ